MGCGGSSLEHCCCGEWELIFWVYIFSIFIHVFCAENTFLPLTFLISFLQLYELHILSIYIFILSVLIYILPIFFSLCVYAGMLIAHSGIDHVFLFYSFSVRIDKVRVASLHVFLFILSSVEYSPLRSPFSRWGGTDYLIFRSYWQSTCCNMWHISSWHIFTVESISYKYHFHEKVQNCPLSKYGGCLWCSLVPWCGFPLGLTVSDMGKMETLVHIS